MSHATDFGIIIVDVPRDRFQPFQVARFTIAWVRISATPLS